MRKPIKPFFVETRRGGRKPLGPRLTSIVEDEPTKPVQTDWPPVPEDDNSYVAAMRAADALFSRPAPAPSEADHESEAPSMAAPPEARRILPSLNEDDHIARLLAEEAETQPRRGRKPRDPSEPAPMRVSRSEPTAPAVHADETRIAVDRPCADFVPGYVRGQIFARYARHDQTRPGEQWRKRGLKPLW